MQPGLGKGGWGVAGEISCMGLGPVSASEVSVFGWVFVSAVAWAFRGYSVGGGRAGKMGRNEALELKKAPYTQKAQNGG